MGPNNFFRPRIFLNLAIRPLAGILIGVAFALQFSFNLLLFGFIGLILGTMIAVQQWKVYRQIPSMQPGEYIARRGAYMASAAVVFVGILIGGAISYGFELPEYWGAVLGGIAGLGLAIPVSRRFNEEIDEEFGIRRD